MCLTHIQFICVRHLVTSDFIFSLHFTPIPTPPIPILIGHNCPEYSPVLPSLPLHDTLPCISVHFNYTHSPGFFFPMVNYTTPDLILSTLISLAFSPLPWIFFHHPSWSPVQTPPPPSHTK